MKHIPYLFAAIVNLFAMPAFGQTCASPLSIAVDIPTSGSTCGKSIQLPSLANGAINAVGEQDVYHFTAADSKSTHLIVQPEVGLDLSVFVCRNQCATYATCVQAVDENGPGGSETASIPDGPGDYFVIVGTTNSAPPTCGNYTMLVSGPLSD